MQTDTIALWTDQDPPTPLVKVVKRIRERSDEECKTAFEIFESSMPHDMVSVIEMYASQNWVTKIIWSRVKRALTTEVMLGDQRRLEVIILAIEHCVREQAKKAVTSQHA